MRVVYLVVMLMCPAMARAGEPSVLRPLDACAAEVVSQALERSSLVRELAAALPSDVIVHVVTSAHLPAGIAGTTQFVASRGGHRYLRITLARQRRRPDRLAMFAHELQHAHEMAQAPARDTAGYRAWFQHLGYRQGEDVYETSAARQVERRVRAELKRWGAAPTDQRTER